MENKNNFVSLIIPAYKQEQTIVKDLTKIKRSLDRLKQNYEVIVVVDGKVDRTFEEAGKLQSSKVKILSYDVNRGKGYAIKYGMKRAKGNIIGFIDAGMDLDPRGLSTLLERFKRLDADIIIGSKRHPESKVAYPLLRRIISFFSQVFIRILFGLNVRDTQVGIKFFKREVIENVLPRLLVKGYAFDIEILVVALHFDYCKIFEAPIELRHNFKSSIVSQSLISAILRTFWDSLAIFYRLKIAHYYDKIKK